MSHLPSPNTSTSLYSRTTEYSRGTRFIIPELCMLRSHHHKDGKKRSHIATRQRLDIQWEVFNIGSKFSSYESQFRFTFVTWFHFVAITSLYNETSINSTLRQVLSTFRGFEFREKRHELTITRFSVQKTPSMSIASKISSFAFISS